jgi:hypothetical protein
MTDYPLVLVEWEDATGGNRSGWREIADMKPRLDLVRSVGWLIHKDRRSVTICPNISVTQGDADLSVPRKWIKRMVKLTEGEPL